MRTAGTTEPAPPKEEPHEQRMKNLEGRAFSPLTRREYQVADCIMRGLRRSEIEEELGIKPSTINDHRKAIYSKFGINSRKELFRLAESLNREWENDD